MLPDGNVDWEIEVVAVIGRGGFRIDRDAWDAVAGLTAGQDLSERLLELAGTPRNSPWRSRTRGSAPSVRLP